MHLQKLSNFGVHIIGGSFFHIDKMRCAMK